MKVKKKMGVGVDGMSVSSNNGGKNETKTMDEWIVLTFKVTVSSLFFWFFT